MGVCSKLQIGFLPMERNWMLDVGFELIFVGSPRCPYGGSHSGDTAGYPSAGRDGRSTLPRMGRQLKKAPTESEGRASFFEKSVLFLFYDDDSCRSTSPGACGGLLDVEDVRGC